jgi:hypothetical protein
MATCVAVPIQSKAMRSTAETFADLAREVARADRISYPLAELNDLLTAATGPEVEHLPRPEIEDPYRLNYVTAMVELAAHRTDVVPPVWTSDVMPLAEPVFIDRSPNLRAHLLTASPVPFRRRNIFIDTSLGGRV